MKKQLARLALALLALTALPTARAASYPLKTCIVTGDDLGDDPVEITYKGRVIRLCCKSCARKFNANPAKYTAILDKELARKTGAKK